MSGATIAAQQAPSAAQVADGAASTTVIGVCYDPARTFPPRPSIRIA
jgi:hypothetical protein